MRKRVLVNNDNFYNIGNGISTITYQEGKTYAHVLQDGIIEPCLITTGVSNCQYTEVTNGLNEGQQVIVY